MLYRTRTSELEAALFASGACSLREYDALSHNDQLLLLRWMEEELAFS